MGRGIAVTFALAGHRTHLVDLKERSQQEFDRFHAGALQEIKSTLTMLAEIGLFAPVRLEEIVGRINIYPSSASADAFASAAIVFEAVPETLDAKRDAFGVIGTQSASDAIIASTTSTILSDDLAPMVAAPRRFLNAHWLNPAFLVPLVELSPSRQTAPETIERLKTLLESIGKIPVVCKPSPGYIVPRIQMLAMNEAARLAEEGVASVEDIDKATKYGFGFRFAILGMLEFIDWGGGDILFHASNYMKNATGEDRFDAPSIVKQNMENGRTGLNAGEGFLEYDSMDVAAYRRERMASFVAMLRHLDLVPKLD